MGGEDMAAIKTVGIVGFGVMGAAIGLNAATAGYQVVFKEMNDDLVKLMYDKWVLSALGKRVEKGKMTQEQMDEVTARIRGTSRYEDLGDCDLVIEAAVENLDLKIQIFGDLSQHCKDDAILVSNTSTFLIEKVMSKVSGQERTAGLHYFFPANVNKLVEVIRQKQTSDATYQALCGFAERNRKTAITVKDFPGFAINPIFIAAYSVLDSFYDGGTYNVATLDDISKEALGVRFGVMWVQNGSGLGTAYHAATSMVDYLAATDVGYPPVSAPLKAQFEKGQPWDLEDGAVNSDPAARSVVKDRLLGAIFAIATHLIEKDVVSVADLELGICTSLAWPKGPFGMMNELGMEETARLVKGAVKAGDFKLPQRFTAGTPQLWQVG
jgi:3-hydroxyacyl-CoA dehydrogenase